MDLQTLLDEQNLSMYRLSKISGVPKTTVIDICSGKSDIRNCTAYTVYKIAKTLNCSMEDLMLIDTSDFNRESGLPKNRDYLERGLPPYLRQSIEVMKQSWEIEDAGKKDLHWDVAWCDLNADINSAETEQDITHDQARYLREKYLRMEE
ncbi:MAG: helix-turn-helix transcriptional regulator [Erysipelotrichaceae bacterium]|nr:helix-turn-helix transcriptional regulator [Erysipelotrichaceae bacterium]